MGWWCMPILMIFTRIFLKSVGCRTVTDAATTCVRSAYAPVPSSADKSLKPWHPDTHAQCFY
eukprot:scaffold275772_cov15-Tisochrysis_lutea.AAC.1